MSKTGRILGLAGLTLAVSAAPAGAILNGTADDSGLYPEVGALIRFEPLPDGAEIECSGTLISPTVFLTAAHCDQGNDQVDVTFDQYVDGGTRRSGTFIVDPAYAKGDPHADIAIVQLDHPVGGITPARLPALGSLSSLGKNDRFTSVGYGANAVGQSGGPKTLTYTNSRYYATDIFSSLTSTALKLSQNASKGNGGTCYGDSGGPNFLGTSHVIAGTTITGDTWCGSTNVDLRLDIALARDFLGQYVALP